jgi:hypothetical protein
MDSSFSNVGLHKATELLEIALNTLKFGMDTVGVAAAKRIGTMGPLTCSAEALTMFLHTRNMNALPTYYSSFEEVCAALLRGEVDEALVPHCHPIASELLFDHRFEFDMARAFDKPNPPLHLATRPGTPFPPPAGVLCAALPTLWPLVGEVAPEKFKILPVVSNPAAARALREGAAPYAITNEASLAAFELQSVRALKHVVVRWFPVRVRHAKAA